LFKLSHTKVLCRYLPPTLFMETNLPAVKIKMGKKNVRSEDIELSLSTYLPGKVSFRCVPGLIVPIYKSRKRRKNKLVIITDKVYELRSPLLSSHEKEKIREELPFSFKVYLNTFGLPWKVDFYRLGGVNAQPFLWNNGYHWMLWLTKEHMMSIVFEKKDIENILKRYRIKNIYFLTERSTVYPLFNLTVLKSLEKTANTLQSIAKRLGFNFIESDVSYYSADIFKYLYALNLELEVRAVRSSQYNNSCSLPQLRKVTRFKRKIIGTRILARDEDMLSPILLGFKIEDTPLLKLTPDVEEFIEYFLKKGSQLIIQDSLSGYTKYAIIMDLTINQLLGDIGCHKLLTNLNHVFSYFDIFCNEPILDIIENGDNLFHYLLWFDEKLSETSKCPADLLIFKEIIGERLSSCNFLSKIKKINQSIKEKIENRLKEISSQVKEAKFNILMSILNHTFSHHFLKAITFRSSVNSRYLGEIYHSYFTHPNSGKYKSFYIYEISSGGVGALESVVNTWQTDKQSFIIDVLLQAGSCIIGMPEDLVYNMLLKNYKPPSSIDEARCYVIQGLKDVDLLITPEECEEAARLSFSITKEFDMRGWDIAKEVAYCRRALEDKIKRTALSHEICINVLKNLSSCKNCKEVLEEIIQRTSEAQGWNVDVEILDEIREALFNVENKLVEKIRKGDKSMRKIVREIGRILEAALLRFVLTSCPTACGWCYINSSGCSESSAPWLQALTLNRRLLKHYATWTLKRVRDKRNEGLTLASVKIGGDVIKVIG